MDIGRAVDDALGASAMLAGRSAIVTGAGRGIGAAVARLFGQHGACVLVNDLDEAAAQATANAVTAAGATPCYLPSPCPLVLGVPSSLGSLGSKIKTPRARGLRTFAAPPHRRTAAPPHRRIAAPPYRFQAAEPSRCRAASPTTASRRSWSRPLSRATARSRSSSTTPGELTATRRVGLTLTLTRTATLATALATALALALALALTLALAIALALALTRTACARRFLWDGVAHRMDDAQAACNRS